MSDVPVCDKCSLPSTIVLSNRKMVFKVAACKAHEGWATRRYERELQRSRTEQTKDE